MAEITTQTVKSFVDHVMTWISWVAHVLLIILLFAALARVFGFSSSLLPFVGALDLVYYALAYALMSGKIRLG